MTSLKKTHTNLDKIREYHKAIYEINSNDNYEDLFEIYNENDDLQDLISDCMLKNKIYETNDLLDLMDADLRVNRTDSQFWWLIAPYQNSRGEYLKINDSGKGFTNQYNSINEVYKEICDELSTKLNKNFFDELKVQK